MSILVAGVDFSGAKTEPNETWLVVSELSSLGMQVKSVKRTGSQGLKKELDAIKDLSVVALDFPFSLPVEFLRFLERKLGKEEYQEWQEVAMQLVFMSYDEFEAMVEEYDIEPKRFTDKNCGRPAQSPLHRVNPSMVQMTYQGMRMLSSLDPNRYWIAPFNDPKPGTCAVLEVYPREILWLLALPDRGYKSRDKKNHEKSLALRKEIVDGLINLRERGDHRYETCPRLSMDNASKGQFIASDHALDALAACYGAAVFAQQKDLFPDPFDANNLNILLEGWIFAPSKLRG